MLPLAARQCPSTGLPRTDAHRHTVDGLTNVTVLTTRNARCRTPGFLEALVRLAVLKALPTDAELDAADEPDAGRHLACLERDNKEAYDVLVRSRAVPWGEEPLQPIERCVHHMVNVILWRMQKHPHPDYERDVGVEKMIDQYFK
jgi:hypothetical protein